MKDTGDKTILMIWHSRTGAARQMMQAAARGALDVARQLAVPTASPGQAGAQTRLPPAARKAHDGARLSQVRDMPAQSGMALLDSVSDIRGDPLARADFQEQGLRLCIRHACETHAEDLLAADAYLFCAPENLAALAGAMKEFFDRTYYAVLDMLNGRPYALMISAGSDGSGAARQAERICTGWRLSPIAPALVVNFRAQTAERIWEPKMLEPADGQACHTLGGTLAALLL
ncbi:flavodoxin family protein [Allopusillimonas soli]